MEHHGNNPQQKVIAIIPARYSSTRLPGKLLLDVAGKPLILHTLAKAWGVSSIDRVIVATDDTRIYAVVIEAGGEAVMTSPNHLSGTDRVAEAAAQFSPDTMIVNIQADEPMISPTAINLAVEAMKHDQSADIVTTCAGINDPQDVLNPNIVKVVTDRAGYAIYFSRSPIPYLRDDAIQHKTLENALIAKPELLIHFKKHTGLYVYRNKYLQELTSAPQTELEKCEMLEQLRALQSGAGMKVVETTESSIGVDTQEDLIRVREMLAAETF